MTKEKGNHDQGTNWIRRIARIWSAPLILYALLMFIGYAWSWLTTGTADPYAVQNTASLEALAPTLMFLGILGLAIAWRWERLGGAIDLIFQTAVIITLLFTKPITQDFSRFVIPYALALLAAIPGILFLLYWQRSNKKLASQADE